uniref:Eyes absent homolog n=1 Tax=Panagrellus redivivus TaxID=6233 RepID=A0A7E4W019_PANRE
MPTMPVTNQTTALDNLYGAATAAGGTTAPTVGSLSAANPYYNAINYNNTAAAAYGMYNPQCYVASTLRNAQAAAGVTTNFANYLSPTAYYGTGYGTGAFDYTGYNANPYGYGSGRNSASGYYGSANGLTGVGNGLPYTDSLSASSSGGNTTSAQISPYNRQGGGETKSRKRTKNSKPKGGLTSPEPTYSRVFVWEFDDLCLGLSNGIGNLGNIIQVYGFQLKDPTECDQTNIEDANVDDTIQEICYNNAANPSSNNNNVKLECGSPKHEATDNSPPASLLSGAPPTMSNPASRNCVAGLREMAARYQKIKEVYNSFRENPSEIENFCRQFGHVESLDEFITHADNYKMVEMYRQCLSVPMERCNTTNTYTNIIITSESLASTMAKLLLTKLAPFVPAENIYSSHKGSKMETFERVLQRFKKNMVIVSINRNLETKEFAKKENLPLWPIRTYPSGAPILQDVQNFYHALDKVLC